MKGRNERYHDRIAPIYDDVYDKSPYWRFYRDLTWRSIKPHLPRDAGARIADLGCGTGEWGLRCLASGYRVTFVDLSNEMLCRARERVSQEYPGKEAAFVHADLADMAELETGAFALAIAQGDPLSFTKDPARGAREIARILAPGGVAVCSVDNRCAAYDHSLESEDWDALEELHKKGTTVWLARDSRERFPIHAFLPGELRKLFERAGLECLSLVGKTALDIRRHAKSLEDPNVYRRLLAIELECRAEPAFLGRAAHLEIVVRRGGG
jgi:S-adenosylmethionine-dependent methyltransferase